MGIQGLLPLLKSIQLPISAAELSGNTVGIDAYCWLHKGAYGCALQLAEGQDSDIYVNYVLRRVNMLLYHKVKPILVFDGGHLPSKSEKEAERRIKRKENRSQGLSHLQKGNRTQALECFQKSIDITPEMAYKVIKACREKGVDCIVAPYEADAQLTYLMKKGLTQFTISEDSDLLVYGCEKVIFKMDANGSGFLVDIKSLPKLAVLRMEGFTEKKFREMCILSGCDYLQSVKGMGLITAHKLLRKHSTVNKLIRTLRLNNKMKVPQDYEARFAQAEQTFLYQVVFDPNYNKLVPLNPIPDDINPNDLHFAGHNGKWQQGHALQLALGNLNPITGKAIGNIKVAKIVSFDNQVEGCGEIREVSTTPSMQNKGPHSLLSSSGNYEAQKNLNGFFRETKSSEKTNTPFVTPMRTKRTHAEAEEKLSEGSKLSRLYLRTNEGHSVKRRLETNPDDDIPPENQQRTQLRRRTRNPFRSPVRASIQSEQVVSRYFGLAGMEVIKEELSTGVTKNAAVTDADKNKITVETQLACPQTSSPCSSPKEDPSVLGESTESASEESGYYSQTIDCSPLEESNEPADKVTTPLFARTPNVASEERNFPNTPATAANCESHEPPNKRMKSCQTSLDMFTYVKRNTSNTFKETNSPIAPQRTILGNLFSQNFEHGEFNKCQRDEKDENLKKDDFSKIPEDNQDGEVRNLEGNIGHRKRRKNIALRDKPTTGLGRCRTVGLSRLKPGTRKKSTDFELPLLNFFAYHGRSSPKIPP